MRTKYKQRAVDYLILNQKNELFLDNEEHIKEIENYVKDKKCFLEIGPGKGQFILQMAKKYQDINFLVIELNKTISGIALKAIDEAKLTNVKLICDNFYNLTKLIKNIKFAGIFLNFSDPRPKKKHKKRRLTHPLFLVEYAKILEEGSYLYFKTDNDLLFEFSMEMFEKYKWQIISKKSDYTLIDEFDAQTEFETKYKNNGIKIKRVILSKSKDTIQTVFDEDL